MNGSYRHYVRRTGVKRPTTASFRTEPSGSRAGGAPWRDMPEEFRKMAEHLAPIQALVALDVPDPLHPARGCARQPRASASASFSQLTDSLRRAGPVPKGNDSLHFCRRPSLRVDDAARGGSPVLYKGAPFRAGFGTKAAYKTYVLYHLRGRAGGAKFRVLTGLISPASLAVYLLSPLRLGLWREGMTLKIKEKNQC